MTSDKGGRKMAIGQKQKYHEEIPKGNCGKGWLENSQMVTIKMIVERDN